MAEDRYGMKEVGVMTAVDGPESTSYKKPLSPLQSIRRHCLMCAGRPSEVRLCRSLECNLYRFRMGNNPSRKGIGPGRIIKAHSEVKREHSVGASEQNGDRASISAGGGSNRVISKEIRLVTMEAVGKVQMVDRRIIIELTQG